MNHSCEPNCRMLQIIDSVGRLRLLIISKKDIPANTQLTYHYDMNVEDKCKLLMKCMCNSTHCTGYMGIRKVTLRKFLKKNGYESEK